MNRIWLKETIDLGETSPFKLIKMDKEDQQEIKPTMVPMGALQESFLAGFHLAKSLFREKAERLRTDILDVGIVDPQVAQYASAVNYKVEALLKEIGESNEAIFDHDKIKNMMLTYENARLKGELIGTMMGLLQYLKDPEIIKNIEKRIADLEKDEGRLV